MHGIGRLALPRDDVAGRDLDALVERCERVGMLGAA
jgi:hypothetical protein